MLRPHKVDEQHINASIPGANYCITMRPKLFRAIEFMLDDKFGYRWFYREDFQQNDVTVYIETKEDIEEVIKLMTFGRLKI